MSGLMNAPLAPEAHALEEAALVHAAALSDIVLPAEIVRWADAWIMALDEPPYWLIELSTLKSPRGADYAAVISPELERRLKSTECVSLVIAAFDRQLLDLETALAKIFEIWLPISKMAPDDAPDPFDHSLFEEGPIPDLLVTWDCIMDEPVDEAFRSRCAAAFQAHVARHGAVTGLSIFTR